MKDQAYQHIREKLVMTGLSPGTRLSDHLLAKEMGISRGPVREAISQLATEGLLDQIPRYGAFVPRLEWRDLEELYDLRELLESQAAARAAERIRPEQAEELEKVCELLRKMARQWRDGQRRQDERYKSQWVRADLLFHLRIVEIAGNRRTLKIVSDFRILTKVCGRPRTDPLLSPLAVKAATWRDHRRILRALQRRDPAGAQYWMARHIRLAREAAHRNYELSERTGGMSQDAWPDSVQRLIAEMEGSGA